MHNRYVIAGLILGFGLLAFGLGRLSAREVATPASISGSTTAGEPIPVVTGGDGASGLGVDTAAGQFHESATIQVGPGAAEGLQDALQVSPNELNNLNIN